MDFCSYLYVLLIENLARITLIGGILVYKQAYSLYLALIRKKGGQKSFFLEIEKKMSYYRR